MVLIRKEYEKLRYIILLNEEIYSQKHFYFSFLIVMIFLIALNYFCNSSSQKHYLYDIVKN